MQSVKPLLLAVICVLLLQVFADATDLRGRIDGTSFQDRNQPIPLPHVRVALLAVRGGSQDTVVAAAVTGPDGMYFFHNISPGQYVIEVNGRHYPIFVTAGEFQDLQPLLVR
jgi:hypothetical protein